METRLVNWKIFVYSENFVLILEKNINKVCDVL